MDIVLERPHLWDGVKNPYLYKGVVILRKDGKEIDPVSYTHLNQPQRLSLANEDEPSARRVAVRR